MLNVIEQCKLVKNFAEKVICVACYCRVSTDEQAKFGFSIQAQKDVLEKYCKEHNYKYKFYIDEGISASSMKRPALQKMLNDLSTFDMIIFTKLDRLSRNVLDANTINKMLIDNNCTMKAIDEDDIDTSTADGTFIFNLKVSLAQREIEKTSERINFVFENKREKGEVTSGSKKYGYDIINKKLEINKEEAENILNLYQYFVKVNGDMKETYSYFITHFKNKGYDALHMYLRDTAYIGKYKLYRKNKYIDDYCPRIITDELFFKVQSLLKKKERSTNNIKSLFSGLLYCSKCGNRLTKKVDYRVKNIVIRYSCNNTKRYIIGTSNKKCNNTKTIREDYLENYILNNLQEEAKKYITKVQIMKKSNTVDNSKEINDINKRKERLKELYLDGLVDKDTLKKDYATYDKRLLELKQEENKNNSNIDLNKLYNLINSDISTIYNSLSDDKKRTFFLSIIDKIYIEDGEIKEVTFA